MKFPADEMDWRLVAANYKEAWNFDHCIGALDGKHVVMKAPQRSGSMYFNYKHSFSIVLMALVDASYKFIGIDVGAYGRSSDSGVLRDSEFGQKFLNGELNIPEPQSLEDAPGIGRLPYVMVGDEAFPLTQNLMRPFPGRKGRLPLHQAVFNYRLSRARRVVENAFGILVARWRIFERKINLNPENTRKAVLATCVLHNYLQSTSTPLPVQAIEETENNQDPGLLPFDRIGYHPAQEAMTIRNAFADYFTNINPLPWQLEYVQRGLIN